MIVIILVMITVLAPSESEDGEVMMMLVKILKMMVVVAWMVIKILYDNFCHRGLFAERKQKQNYNYAHPETLPAVTFTRSELRSGKADWDDQNLAFPRGARRMNTLRREIGVSLDVEVRAMVVVMS